MIYFVYIYIYVYNFICFCILKAVVGPLSSDFLRISTPREVQEAADRQAALALYQQQQQIVPSYMV